MKKFIITVAAITLAALINEASACTTAIVSPQASKSGKALLWKQRDGSNPHNVLVHIPAGEGTFAFTGIFNAKDKERKDCWGGSNEKGFSLVNNMSFNVSEEDVSSDNGKIISEALKACATIGDFENYLRKFESRKCSSNFACIDATGCGAYFEVSVGLLKRYDVPEGGWLVRTNFSFAGEPDGPSGLDRYNAAEYLMSKHKGKFTAEDLIDGLGRSYYNSVGGCDALKIGKQKAFRDDGYIARPSTVSSICVEGTDLMWVAIGCTPDSFSVPVLVSAGDDIPEMLKASGEEGLSEGCEYSLSLNHYCHLFNRDISDRYLDVRKAKATLAAVRKFEASAMKLGRTAYQNGTPASKSDIAKVNRDIAGLFESFKAATNHAL